MQGCHVVFLNSPFPTVASKFFGVRPLILHGLAALGAFVALCCLSLELSGNIEPMRVGWGDDMLGKVHKGVEAGCLGDPVVLRV